MASSLRRHSKVSRSVGMSRNEVVVLDTPGILYLHAGIRLMMDQGLGNAACDLIMRKVPTVVGEAGGLYHHYKFKEQCYRSPVYIAILRSIYTLRILDLVRRSRWAAVRLLRRGEYGRPCRVSSPLDFLFLDLVYFKKELYDG